MQGAEKTFGIDVRKGRRSRIWELDFLRGVCVLLMVFDHAMYDLALQFGNTWINATDSEFLIEMIERAREYWRSELRYTVQDIVVWLFALLCGISCSFSKNNFKRGVEDALFAGIITVVTTAIGSPITFGILHMFAVAILVWVIVNVCCGGDKHKTALVCLVLGLAIIFIDYGFMQAYELDPNAFADDDSFFWLAHWMKGAVPDSAAEVVSADYYPVFPTAGYMLVGAAAAPALYPKRRSLLPWLGKYDWYKPFSFWGKIALWVYVLHQVVLAVIFAIVSFIFVTPGDFVII